MHDEHETMSRRARRAHAEKQKRRARLPGLPFFLALGILTVIAWILPPDGVGKGKAHAGDVSGVFSFRRDGRKLFFRYQSLVFGHVPGA